MNASIRSFFILCTLLWVPLVPAHAAPAPVLDSLQWNSIAAPPFLARAYGKAREGACAEALRDIRAIRRSPKFKRVPAKDLVHLIAGVCFWKEGDLKRAEVELQESLKYRHANSDTLYLLGWLSQQRGDVEQALRLLDDAAWFNRHAWISRIAVLVKIGALRQTRGETEKATIALNAAAQLDASDPEAPLALSELALSQKDRTGAVHWAEEALRRQSDNPRSQLQLSIALLAQADRVLQADDIRRARDVVGNVLGRKDLEASLRLAAYPVYARALLENGELEKAEQSLEEALGHAPLNEELLLLKQQLQVERSASGVNNPSLQQTSR